MIVHTFVTAMCNSNFIQNRLSSKLYPEYRREKMSMVSSPLDSSNIIEISSITSKIPSDILAFFPNTLEAKLLKGGDVNQCYYVKTPKETFAFRLGIANPGKYGFNRDE